MKNINVILFLISLVFAILGIVWDSPRFVGIAVLFLSFYVVTRTMTI